MVVTPAFPRDTEVAPLVPKLKAAAVVSTVPAPANVNAVAVVPMVSIEATPVKAPPVVTFNPPLEVKAKVPVELPMATLPVLVVARFKVPVVPGVMLRAVAVPEVTEPVPANPIAVAE